jgi:Arc/MetJ family transcription regulator
VKSGWRSIDWARTCGAASKTSVTCAVGTTRVWPGAIGVSGAKAHVDGPRAMHLAVSSRMRRQKTQSIVPTFSDRVALGMSGELRQPWRVARMWHGPDAVASGGEGVDVDDVLFFVDEQHSWRWPMAVTQIDIDQDALDRAMALSNARTKKDVVNLALRYYADRQERAARIGRHFERARRWGAVEDAEREHQAEKEAR